MRSVLPAPTRWLAKNGAPSTVKPSRLASRASLAESESGPRRS
ncbi:MAG: hypothetical protein ACLVB5_02350 [Christensenellales bacterium]